MKKSIVLFLFGLLVLAGCGKLIPSEGSWLCTKDGWVRHGSPSAQMPTEPCGEPSVEPTEEPIKAPIDNPSESANIKVTSPSLNQRVGSPFTIKGEARVFENQLNWKLKGANGSVMSEGTGTANAPDMGQYGPFEIGVSYSLAQESEGILEVFDYSAKDGAVQDLVSIPVLLNATPMASGTPKTPGMDEIAIKLYFANSKLDPEMTCEKVFAAERIVPKSKTMARVAVEELLKGPTEAEKAQGFSTTINPNVKINRLVIVDGVAQVDFDAQLEYQVGGSCRVGLISRQITETLKQFPTVKQVKISIGGRTEDILQP